MLKGSIGAVVAGTLIAASVVAAAHPPKPRLTMTQARAIALKIAPGRVVDAEYEKEAGAWRYSFDIRQGRRIHEIGVSARTGRIVEDKYEGLHERD
jgi:uncharacterized membrane protein YkoI